MVYDKFLVDEFSIVAIYNKIKELFPKERLFLLESVINNSDGNYSFIFVGEKERLSYKDYKLEYFDGEKKEILDEDPFSFLKKYYSKIDKDKYKKIAKELKIGFVDGFVGYIGYDMVKVFEPVLKNVMDNLKDETDIPDFYMIRPKIVIGFSHKFSELTIIINDKKYEN
jgi:anthranilate synthase component 1